MVPRQTGFPAGVRLHHGSVEKGDLPLAAIPPGLIHGTARPHKFQTSKLPFQPDAARGEEYAKEGWCRGRTRAGAGSAAGRKPYKRPKQEVVSSN